MVQHSTVVGDSSFLSVSAVGLSASQADDANWIIWAEDDKPRTRQGRGRMSMGTHHLPDFHACSWPSFIARFLRRGNHWKTMLWSWSRYSISHIWQKPVLVPLIPTCVVMRFAGWITKYWYLYKYLPVVGSYGRRQPSVLLSQVPKSFSAWTDGGIYDQLEYLLSYYYSHIYFQVN